MHMYICVCCVCVCNNQFINGMYVYRYPVGILLIHSPVPVFVCHCCVDPLHPSKSRFSSSPLCIHFCRCVGLQKTAMNICLVVRHVRSWDPVQHNETLEVLEAGVICALQSNCMICITECIQGKDYVRCNRRSDICEWNVRYQVSFVVWDFWFSPQRVCWVLSSVRPLFHNLLFGTRRTHRPDHGSSKHLRNVGQFLPDCTAQYTKRQSSSFFV
jgi:hypothetical protein